MLFALAILAAAGAGEVGAQPYPSKPVRIIVPNATSGLADICARLLATKLGEALGQTFLVDNRPGAGGTLGTAAAARSAPDGTTLLAVFDSHATNPHLFASLPYDTLADFAPISLLARGPLVLVAGPKLGSSTVGELVRLAKARPGAVNFAAVGPGSPARLLMELLKLEAAIDVTMVPYKGAGLALGDLVAGQVDAMFIPDVPAMSETYPDFVSEAWVGLLAPAKAPRDIVARLNAEITSVLGQPEMKRRFAELGLETAPGSPADLDRWIRTEMERWGRVIRERKITLE